MKHFYFVMSDTARQIVSMFQQVYDGIDLNIVGSFKSTIYFPQFSEEDLIKLFRAAQDIFKIEPLCLDLTGPIHVVGDLHGHILDLFRVLKTYGLPKYHKMLFLGDIVDRGEFSTETITLVLALKVAFPDNVHIIRGNHEFSELNETCGFIEELRKIYNMKAYDIYEKLLSVFKYLPVLAIINKKILCVHGGLGPHWFSLNQVRKIKKPIESFEKEILDGIFWSDPNDAIDFYAPSSRGTGYFFGKSAVEDFLDSNSLDLIVRAHECTLTGINFMFNERLVTVFGASNYCGMVNNYAGVLTIDKNGGISSKTFPPLYYLRRENVYFMTFLGGRLLQNNRKNLPEVFSSMQLPTLKARINKLPPLSLMPHPATAHKPNTPHSDPRRFKGSDFSFKRIRWPENATKPSIRVRRAEHTF